MDASNEFKVFLSPSSSSSSKKQQGEDGGQGGSGSTNSGVRQRLVPVINKVFSPSHFMLAQRKTTVYKAVSGVSFQDIDIGGKRKSSSSGRRESRGKKDGGIYMPGGSEGERSLQSTKSERVRSFLASRPDAKKHHRHSLGSHPDRPSAYFAAIEATEKTSSGAKMSRGKSASRSRSASATDNLYIEAVNRDVAPVKPQRSRSASRPRKSASKTEITANTSVDEKSKEEKGKERKEKKEDKTDEKCSSEEKQRDRKEEKQRDRKEEKQRDRKEDRHRDRKEDKHKDIKEDKQRDRKEEKHRDRKEEKHRDRKEEKQLESKKENIKGERKDDKKEEEKDAENEDTQDKLKMKKEEEKEKEEEEPEGGYFSLEKEDKGSVGDLEADQCVEAIYVSQVLRSPYTHDCCCCSQEDNCSHHITDHSFHDCQKCSGGNDLDHHSYENYQVMRQASTSDLVQDDDDDEENIYETLPFVANSPLVLTQKTAQQARLGRRRRRHTLGDSTDSIPFIDDSDHDSGGEEVAIWRSENPVRSRTLSPTRDQGSQISPSLTPVRSTCSPARSSRSSVSPSRTVSPPRSPTNLSVTSGGVTVVTITADNMMEITSHSDPPLPQHSSSPSSTLLDTTNVGSENEKKNDTPEVKEPPPEGEKRGGILAPLRPARHSLPASSPFAARLRDKIGRKLARFSVSSHHNNPGAAGKREATLTPIVRKSVSQGDVQNHLAGKNDGTQLSESFSDEDIRNNTDIESFSETDSDLDDLDYDLFCPRGNGRSHGKGIRKGRGRSVSACHPVAHLITMASPGSQRVSKIQSPKTFQDLLDHEYLNPREGNSSPRVQKESVATQASHENTEMKPLVILETPEKVLVGSRIMMSHSASDIAQREVFQDETLSFSWSDAESEFEFIDFNKIDPPKTCVVYQGVVEDDEGDIDAATTVTTTTTTTATTTTVKMEGKRPGGVKRTQSMKDTSFGVI
ncbi:hypothetical protein Pcinc_021503 [Petrolisthes cinctipes]|uniref:Uncharacterized protein n=1 Tax=Petrolisthes cinctipes TaxID=88211 RepID=A0AAE1KIB0_PETCI|nr:hypothetical protein Pcinc_021503 [Petrolisthes cinctipes]